MTPEYLNSWNDSWCGTTVAPQGENATPTIEDIRRTMREFQEKWKDVDLGPDVWVLTLSEFEKLKQHCEDHYPPLWCNGLPSDPWTIYGVRIESYFTKQEVRDRVLELTGKGVKAGFLANEDGK